MPPTRPAFVFLSVALLVTSPAHGQDVISTDRPSFGAGSAIVSPGQLQVESGYTFTHTEAVDVHTIGEVLVRIGIVERLELYLGLNSFAIVDGPTGSVDGIEDATAGVKVRLHEPPLAAPVGAPTVSALLTSRLPTGADAVGETELQPEGRLLVDWAFEDFGLGVNLGVGFPSSAGDHFAQLFASLAMSTSFSDAVSGYVEYYTLQPAAEGASNAGFLNAGLAVLAAHNVQLDGRLGAGLNGTDTDYFFGFGLAFKT